VDRLPDLIGLTFDAVELLDVASRSWLRIRKGHAVRLTVNLHIFLRCRGVECLDFDLHYNLFVRPPRTPNIRTNMRGERDFLASPANDPTKSNSDLAVVSRESTPKWSAKPRRERLLVEDDSGSELEIVEDYIPLPRHKLGGKATTAHGSQPWVSDGLGLGKRKIKDEPSTSQLPAKRHRSLVSRLASKGGFTDPINIESLSDSPTPSASPTIPHIPPSSPSPSRSLGERRNLSPDPELGFAPRWPLAYHTCDMLDGFRRMDSKKMIAKYPTVEDRFVEVFEHGFHNATYYDARRRLKAMKQTDIDHSRDAMRTPEGLWSRLAKKVPLRRQ
jgi:hypothetical protein